VLNLEDVREAVRLKRRFDPGSALSTEDDNRWRNALRLAKG